MKKKTNVKEGVKDAKLKEIIFRMTQGRKKVQRIFGKKFLKKCKKKWHKKERERFQIIEEERNLYFREEQIKRKGSERNKQVKEKAKRKERKRKDKKRLEKNKRCACDAGPNVHIPIEE